MEAAAGWRHPGKDPNPPSDQASSPADDQTPTAASEEPKANYAMLAASVLIMSAVVVVFNRAVWRQLYHLADTLLHHALNVGQVFNLPLDKAG